MENQTNTVNEYKGYSLFNDVEDTEVRNYNRARIMNNIYEDTSDNEGNITAKGMVMIVEYFDLVPKDDRADVHTRLSAIIEKKQESRVKKVVH